MQIMVQPTPLSGERVQDIVASLLVAGANVTLSYNDVANTLTINASGGGGLDTEAAQDLVAAMFPNSSTIDFSYNDTSGVVTATVIASSITESHINLSDIFSDNADTSKHGFLPKLSGNTTTFLRGDGAWITPPSTGAPATADYITASANGTLTAERVLTNTATITWDLATAGQAKANAIIPAAYTNEEAQDAVGGILVDSSTIDFIYNDTTPSITANVIAGSVAPVDAQYIVSSANTNLTSERVATNSTDLVWDFSTPGVAILNITPALGTMARQNANAVAITGGVISIGGHAPTGVSDVQVSIQASDIANAYLGTRIWPTAPAGALYAQAIRVEPTTGAGLATTGFNGLVILDQPVTLASASAMIFNISAGTNRYNIYAPGTAANYFGGNIVLATDKTLRLGSVVMAPEYGSRAEIYHTPAVVGIQFHPDSDTSPYACAFRNAANTLIGSIITSATATTYNTSSDVRLKHAIEKLVGSLDIINMLNPIGFLWNNTNEKGEGFLAHELQQIIPQAVTGEPDALNADGSIKPQQVDHSKLIPRLVGAIQELLARVVALEGAINGA